MRKVKYTLFSVVTICILSMVTVNYISASGAEPGSNSDPVVSKSYVDAQINQLKSMIGTQSINPSNTITTTNTIDSVTKQNLVDEILAVVEALYGDKIDKASNTDITTDKAFLPVQLAKGQYLIGGEGTEIIFRSGQAVAYSKNEMGIIDVSDGVELFNGAGLTVNHLLIVGRNDGRGATAYEDSWFMVKGSYTIK